MRVEGINVSRAWYHFENDTTNDFKKQKRNYLESTIRPYRDYTNTTGTIYETKQIYHAVYSSTQVISLNSLQDIIDNTAFAFNQVYWLKIVNNDTSQLQITAVNFNLINYILYIPAGGWTEFIIPLDTITAGSGSLTLTGSNYEIYLGGTNA